MPTTLTIRDATLAGEETGRLTLELMSATMTVRELIKNRVYQEVQDFNRKKPEVYRGLVQPTGAEKALNGFKLKKRRVIDWEQQYEKAVEAFERNGFLILIDDRQVEALDETVALGVDTTVQFVKLVPLVGG